MVVRGCLIIAGLSTALATDSLAAYRPPSSPSAPSSRSTSSTGVRRGCLNDNGAMVLLAPHSYVGRTVSTRPSVSWFIPDDDSLAMELRLYELDDKGDRTLVEKKALETTPGIMQASLPDTQPALVSGNRYLWQVVVFCNPNRPSSALVDEAEMDVMPPTTEITATLALATSPQTQADLYAEANLYAEAGLWYDALAHVNAMQASAAETPRQNLLQDLAQLEHSSPFAEKLKQLITP